MWRCLTRQCLIAVALIAALPSLSAGAHQADAPKRPNIVLILADDKD
jgi:hypothetical protein